MKIWLCNAANKSLIEKNEQKKRKHELLISESREVISVQILQILNIIRKYYDQLYGNKFNNLDKVDKFFERQKLPKFTQDDIGNIDNNFSSHKEKFILG